MKLVIASNNKGKIREYKQLLEKFGYEVCSQKEAGIDLDVEETGTTFAENSALKARAAYELFDREYRWATPVRALTVRALGLVPQGQAMQSSLFWDIDKSLRLDKLDTAVEGIRSRFGKASIRACCLLQDLHMPDDGRDQVKMPGLMYQ